MRRRREFQDVPKEAHFLWMTMMTTTTRRREKSSFPTFDNMPWWSSFNALALLRFRLSEFLYFLCHMHDDVEISGKGIYHKNAAYRDPLFRILSYIYFTISFFLLYFLGHVFEITRTIFHFQESLQIHCSSQQQRRRR